MCATRDGAPSYAGPLAGVRVVDLTRVLAGPYATTLLADLGAEVLKVEQPGVGDSSRHTPPEINGVGNHFLNLNRNKKSLALDLKSDAGRQAVLDLVAVSDVVVENFRPGVLDRLGLGYDKLKERNPSIILCSISGFGQTGSHREFPSFDIITQAMSGAMAVTGEPGRPPVRLGVPLGDLSGGLFGALSVLAALFERERTGNGQSLDVGMLDALVNLMLYYPIDYLNAGKVARPVGGRHEHIAPYGVFEVADGYLVLAIFTGKFWHAYCEAVGRSDLLEDERFRTAALRLKNKDALYELLDAVMITKPRDEWESLLRSAGIPHAPILTPDQVATHPLMRERDMFVNVRHPQAGEVAIAGRAVKFRDRVLPDLVPAPLLGQDTEPVLRELVGYSDEQIAALHAPEPEPAARAT